MLFEDISRTDMSPMTRTESDFEHLNRSARPESIAVREHLNYWLDQMPDDVQNDLSSRLKTKNRIDFSSASFEILLYALMKQIGAEITFHPKLPSSKTDRPDFEIQLKGECFYLEATTAQVCNRSNFKPDPIWEEVFQKIDEINSEEFFVSVETKGTLKTTPKISLISKKIKVWLDSLDYEKVAYEYHASKSKIQPDITIKIDDCSLTLKAFPRSIKTSGKRLIGIGDIKTDWIDEHTPLKNTILKKARKYGKLDKPFIIAVNAISAFLELDEKMNALFGDECYTFRRDLPEMEPIPGRKMNGVWTTPKGPRYTRLSGCWIFNNYSPWNIKTCKNTLFHNPWGNLPVSTSLNIFTHRKPVGSEMKLFEGFCLEDILIKTTKQL